jgi:4-amino-4-deoxy-L-arabinose transferase-like glycosyltransferase
MKSILQKYFPDIRFWIILFFAIRLIGITNPPLDVAHNWRQTTVAMVARNFVEVDNNILYPRIDIAGEKTGITGMEFPLLNYLIYLVSLVFGYTHWYGRLINLVFSSFGLWFFFRLIQKYFNKKIAFNATLILLFSIWFTYSRKIMPDTFSMSLIIMGFYFGAGYLTRAGGKYHFLQLSAYVLFITTGILSKLPSAYILIVFALFLFDKNIQRNRKTVIVVATALAMLAPAWWYFVWVPHLVEKYGFWHFYMGKSFLSGMNEIIANLPQTLERFYETALKFSGFLVFVFGLIMAWKRMGKQVIYTFLLSFVGFLVVIIKAGFAFPHHSYYIIPFVPVMALVAGYGLSLIKNRKLSLILLVIISLEGILGQQHDFRIKEKEMALLSLETDLDKVSATSDLILINSNNFPTPMYFAHRKGWVLSNDAIADVEKIMELKQKGMKLIVILKRSFGSEMSLDLPLVFENEYYRIYGFATPSKGKLRDYDDRSIRTTSSG